MELWDIYDRDKQRTGRTMKRNDWHMQPGDFHLTVLGVIRHTNGKYLITKRVMTKAWAPGSWEVSGGAAQAGEDSLDAVKREIIFVYARKPGRGRQLFCGYLLLYRRFYRSRPASAGGGNGWVYVSDC